MLANAGADSACDEGASRANTESGIAETEKTQTRPNWFLALQICDETILQKFASLQVTKVYLGKPMFFHELNFQRKMKKTLI